MYKAFAVSPFNYFFLLRQWSAEISGIRFGADSPQVQPVGIKANLYGDVFMIAGSRMKSACMYQYGELFVIYLTVIPEPERELRTPVPMILVPIFTASLRIMEQRKQLHYF
jgi:hypothetical protein